MIVPFSDLVGRARASGRAVGAFTVYGLDVAVAVLTAAERRRAGVILLVSAETFRSPTGRPWPSEPGHCARRAPSNVACNSTTSLSSNWWPLASWPGSGL